MRNAEFWVRNSALLNHYSEIDMIEDSELRQLFKAESTEHLARLRRTWSMAALQHQISKML